MLEIVVVVIASLGVLAGLYLLAIMPRMLEGPDHTPFQGYLYAHRGLHDNAGDAPENSLKAFGKAVEAGYGMELDVQVSRDGIPMVFHDDTLERMCGCPQRLCELNCSQLEELSLLETGEKIPRLEEVLDLVRGRTPLIVELKSETMDVSLCRPVDRLLSAYQGHYCIESFNPLVLLWYKKNRNHVMRGQLSDGFSWETGGNRVFCKGILYFVLEHMLLNFLTRPDFIAYNHKYYKSPSRQICQKLYKKMAVAWTIQSQKELEDRKCDFDLFIFDSFIPGEFL